MSFTIEVDKLNRLRNSGLISEAEFQQSKKRLLEECVSQIEAWHERKVTEFALATPPADVADLPAERQVTHTATVPVERQVPRTTTVPVERQVPHTTTVPVERQAAHTAAVPVYRQVTHTATVPVERQVPHTTTVPVERQATHTAAVPVERQVPHTTTVPVERQAAHTAAVPIERQVPHTSTAPVERQVPRTAAVPVERQAPHTAAVPIERQVPNTAAVPAERQIPSAAAAAAGKVRIPIRGDHAPQTIPLSVNVRPVEVGSALRAEEVKDRQLEEANDRHPEEVNDRHPEVVNDQHADELQERYLEDCLRRFETFYDQNPTYRERWGLPRVKLVRGIVRNVTVSPREDTGDYTASLDIDGRQIEISSSSAVRIAVGDRVTLGGYERDGRLLILGYRNESDGSHSDLSVLRTRYRVLLAIGRVSLFAGLIVIASMLMLLIHMPPAVSSFASWRFTPYVLSGLAAAAACYLGLTLSFLGSWARDFHDAMTPRRLPGLAA